MPRKCAIAQLWLLGLALGECVVSAEKDCAAASNRGAGLRLLIVHEQHLQPMGCDTRLLGIIKGMRGAGHAVSLLFRHTTPVELRSPPSAELAQLLGIRGFQEDDLRADVDTRPAPPRPKSSSAAGSLAIFPTAA